MENLDSSLKLFLRYCDLLKIKQFDLYKDLRREEFLSSVDIVKIFDKLVEADLLDEEIKNDFKLYLINVKKRNEIFDEIMEVVDKFNYQYYFTHFDQYTKEISDKLKTTVNNILKFKNHFGKPNTFIENVNKLSEQFSKVKKYSVTKEELNNTFYEFKQELREMLVDPTIFDFERFKKYKKYYDNDIFIALGYSANDEFKIDYNNVTTNKDKIIRKYKIICEYKNLPKKLEISFVSTTTIQKIEKQKQDLFLEFESIRIPYFGSLPSLNLDEIIKKKNDNFFFVPKDDKIWDILDTISIEDTLGKEIKDIFIGLNKITFYELIKYKSREYNPVYDALKDYLSRFHRLRINSEFIKTYEDLLQYIDVYYDYFLYVFKINQTYIKNLDDYIEYKMDDFNKCNAYASQVIQSAGNKKFNDIFDILYEIYRNDQKSNVLLMFSKKEYFDEFLISYKQKFKYPYPLKDKESLTLFGNKLSLNANDYYFAHSPDYILYKDDYEDIIAIPIKYTNKPIYCHLVSNKKIKKEKTVFVSKVHDDQHDQSTRTYNSSHNKHTSKSFNLCEDALKPLLAQMNKYDHTNFISHYLWQGTHINNLIEILKSEALLGRKYCSHIPVDNVYRNCITRSVMETNYSHYIEHYVRLYLNPINNAIFSMMKVLGRDNFVLIAINPNVIIKQSEPVLFSLGNAHYMSDEDFKWENHNINSRTHKKTIFVEGFTNKNASMIYERYSPDLAEEDKNIMKSEFLIYKEVSISFIEGIYVQSEYAKNKLLNAIKYLDCYNSIKDKIFVKDIFNL